MMLFPLPPFKVPLPLMFYGFPICLSPHLNKWMMKTVLRQTMGQSGGCRDFILVLLDWIGPVDLIYSPCLLNFNGCPPIGDK